MAAVTREAVPTSDRMHTVTRRAATANARAYATITLGDALTADETIIFNSLTWTAKESGATGRQFNIGGSATLTAAAFAAAFNLHADGADYVAVPSGATVTFTRVATGTFTSFTGTANISAQVFGGVNALTSGAAGGIIFEATATANEVDEAIRAAWRQHNRDRSTYTAPSSYPTSGATKE